MYLNLSLQLLCGLGTGDTLVNRHKEDGRFYQLWNQNTSTQMLCWHEMNPTVSFFCFHIHFIVTFSLAFGSTALGIGHHFCSVHVMALCSTCDSTIMPEVVMVMPPNLNIVDIDTVYISWYRPALPTTRYWSPSWQFLPTPLRNLA